MTNVECVCQIGARLGEGPLWSPLERAVWFVDIKGRHIHHYEEQSGRLQSWDAPEEVGFIVPVARGRFICGLKSGLHAFDPSTGRFELIARVDSDRPHNRLNDAHVDARGRLWFGTMDNDEVKPTGALYCFDTQGLRLCDDHYVITNGPVTSPDGRVLYHIDTLQRLIYAFDLDAAGDLSNRRIFARVENGYPDGPTVDATGCLWLGLYGGGGVNRYSPTGQLLDTVKFPVSNCTKPAFGGEDLRTLYVTTAWKGLSEEQRQQQPLAGGLFAVRVDVPGLAPHEVRYDG